MGNCHKVPLNKAKSYLLMFNSFKSNCTSKVVLEYEKNHNTFSIHLKPEFILEEKDFKRKPKSN
jgi:hypothetical protein